MFKKFDFVAINPNMKYYKFKGDDMDKKTTDKILIDFNKLNIPEEEFPLYENPYQFSETFQECSVHEYMNVSYSSTTLTRQRSKKE